jgi:hypothetical protein
MSNINRKATKKEMIHIIKIIKEAFPDYVPIFSGHGNYGGHRKPRDHTISFRLQDNNGKYHSNVIWLMPDLLMTYTIEDIKRMVNKGMGNSKMRG